MRSSWNQLDAFIGRLEKGLIVILLSVMVVMAFSQIILRNVFSTGLSWGEPLVRYLVLWVGFTGAALATREGKHITIELISVWGTGKPRRIPSTISHLCSAVICGLLAFAAVKFLWFEAQMGSTTFLKIPVWVPELIMPLTFGLMGVRYFFKVLATVFRWPDENHGPGPRGDS
jgi:TRAP-type C4-dicarboxylate transport system permease small subunit